MSEMAVAARARRARGSRSAAPLLGLVVLVDPGIAVGEQLLAELEVNPGQGRQGDRVLVADPLSIRARRFRAVFVCGLNEGEFPRAGGSDPFLSDERRRELALASGLRLGPVEEALAASGRV